VNLKDYEIAIKNLKKHKEGLAKDLMRVQLDKYARRELSSNEYTTFELLFDLYLTEGFIKDVLYREDDEINKTSVEDFIS